MSVAVLKADNDLGYWEYNVRTEDHGEWNFELTRMEKVGPERTKNPDHDMYSMHVRINWNGAEFFTSWPYGENAPFLCTYEMNGIGVAAVMEVLAYWITTSSKRANALHAKERLQELLGDALDGMGMEAMIVGIDPETGETVRADDPRVNADLYLTPEDLDRLFPYPQATNAVYMELHHYGMATTTPEWRQDMFGTTEPEPTKWGQCDGDCGHEHS